LAPAIPKPNDKGTIGREDVRIVSTLSEYIELIRNCDPRALFKKKRDFVGSWCREL
jgi:hypothetical protein